MTIVSTIRDTQDWTAAGLLGLVALVGLGVLAFLVIARR